MLYALRYASVEIKFLILFSFAAFAMCLARPLAGPPDHPQWFYLCAPGGNRYYFFPILSTLVAVLWMALGTPHRKLRYVGVALLLVLPIGICHDWSYPKFEDRHFKSYAAQFERAPSGTKFTIPINPALWKMELTKR
jgi:hypothetical protein